MTENTSTSPQDIPWAPPAEPARGSASAQIARFFEWLRGAGVVRGSDRWLAGVCGAIAARTGLDPLIVRGIAVVLAILGAPAVFAYAVAWALLPDRTGMIYAEQAFRKRFEPAMIAIGAILLFTIVPAFRGLWFTGPAGIWGMPDWLATTLSVGWALLITAGIIGLVVFVLRRLPASRLGRSTPAAAAGDSATPAAAPTTGTAAAAADAGAGAAQSFPAGADAVADDTETDAPSRPSNAPTGPGYPGYPAYGSTDSSAAPAATSAPEPSAWDALSDKNREHRDQAAARRAAHEAKMRARNPGAGFTAIILGVALLAGAVTAALFSRGALSPTGIVLGLAVVLGVLALGIIVSGIRGRVSGAMGGFAFLTATALVIVGVIPQGTAFSAFGGSGWRAEPTSSVSTLGPEASPGFAMIAGQADIDLTALADTRNADEVDGRIIDVWVGLGVTEIQLPRDTAVRVETNTLIGAVAYNATGSDNGSPDRGGVLLRDTRTIGAESAENDVPIPVIRVWSLIGQVNVLDPR